MGGVMDVDAVMAGFRKRTVFSVGDLMVDRFIFGRVSRVSPEAPVPVVEAVVESDVPGGAANVVSILGMSGAKVFSSGIVGSDDPGRKLREKLIKEGIDVKGVLVDGKRPTTLKTRIIAHNQQVVRVDLETKEGIGRKHEDRIIDFFSSVARKVDGVIVSDYRKGTVTPRLVEGIGAIARKHKKPVVANTKSGSLAHYRDVDVVMMNVDEANLASGIRPMNEASLRTMGARILSLSLCGNVVIMRGKAGFSVFGRDGSAFNVRAPDMGGVYEFKKTEDTALGFLSLCLFSGESLFNAARFSNYVVEVLAGKTGAGKVTLEDVRESLAVHPLE
jgi:rfaE bifunctional protein kinase chain/domain